jgi:hypothetical protein
MITIGSFPNCLSHYFKDMVTKASKKCGQWANCKRLHIIFTVIYSLDFKVYAFKHALSFSFIEVKLVLRSRILTHCIS